jgi:fumarate reductase subunit C
MSPINADYRLHHPRWHRQRMPIFWWLAERAYVKFIARELTSLAVGYAALLLLAEVAAVARGAAAHARFLRFLSSPPVLAWHLVILGALLFHTVTWLNLAPKAITLRAGGRRVPDAAIVLGHYFLWVVASAAAAWWLLGKS